MHAITHFLRNLRPSAKSSRGGTPARRQCFRPSLEILEDRTLPSISVPGALDPTFGVGGKVTSQFGSYDAFAIAEALQADGKVVVVGAATTRDGDGGFALARYESNGTRDAGFGTGGQVITRVGAGVAEGCGVAVQADGKIVVAGFGRTATDLLYPVLARYNSNGSLDATLGGTGLVTADFGPGSSAHFSLVIQPDGKIVTVGQSFQSSGDYDFFLARYNADGTLDGNFGAGGKVTTDFARGDDRAFQLALQADGKIVVAGVAGQTIATGGSNDFGLARYNPDGTLDAGFGIGGKVTTDFGAGNDWAYTLAIQADGRIVTAGQSFGTINYVFSLVRYDADGSLDNSFGTDGRVVTEFPDSSGLVLVGGIAIQTDGKIVAAGVTESAGRGPDFAVARYNTDGTLDSAFGVAGRVATDFTERTDSIAGVVIQPGGRIVVAGISVDPSGRYDFALARYEAGPSAGARNLSTASAAGSLREANFAVANSLIWQLDLSDGDAGWPTGAPLTANADGNGSLRSDVPEPMPPQSFAAYDAAFSDVAWISGAGQTCSAGDADFDGMTLPLLDSFLVSAPDFEYGVPVGPAE